MDRLSAGDLFPRTKEAADCGSMKLQPRRLRLMRQPMNRTSAVALAVTFISLVLARAHIIGTNVPALPLTAERVADLPALKSYLETSLRQRQADQDFLHAELKAYGLTNAIQPPGSATPKGTPLTRMAYWYGGTEARRIADCVVSFQTPRGGWSKTTDFTNSPRRPGAP